MTEVQNCFICKHLDCKTIIGNTDVSYQQFCAVSPSLTSNLKQFPFIVERDCCEPKDDRR